MTGVCVEKVMDVEFFISEEHKHDRTEYKNYCYCRRAIGINSMD